MVCEFYAFLFHWFCCFLHPLAPIAQQQQIELTIRFYYVTRTQVLLVLSLILFWCSPLGVVSALPLMLPESLSFVNILRTSDIHCLSTSTSDHKKLIMLKFLVAKRRFKWLNVSAEQKSESVVVSSSSLTFVLVVELLPPLIHLMCARSLNVFKLQVS